VHQPEVRPGQDQQPGLRHDALRARILTGPMLVLAPHMDDETLGCGGTMYLHDDKAKIHCLFATDGAGSPAPLLPWQGQPDAGLAARRREEARAATGKLGIPASNLHFLDLPDGNLSSHRRRLETALADALEQLQPEFVFAPFRFDVHPDHVALNRAIRNVLLRLPSPPVLLEYFVYHRLRFVRGGDVLHAIAAERLVEVDTPPVAAAKRAALACYLTQTTVEYPWQERPILTEDSLRQRCAAPEVFLPTDPAAPLADGIGPDASRIRLATLAMRWGKRPKDRAVAFARWANGWRR
jgi:LmbE family N-acetylglucosaminyl deacetylase